MIGKTVKSALAIAIAAGALTGTAFAADIEKGKKVYNKCKTCHIVEAEGPKKMGPTLHGVFGRKSGTVEGYKYSKGMVEAAIVWDAETLVPYLKDPKGTIKGTKMAFAGIKKDTQMADLLAYLEEATKPAE